MTQMTASPRIGPPAKKPSNQPAAVITVCLSLISHTNVGKTTLARTLLRQDVGQILDEEHVTVLAEAYSMLETAVGRLLLWDTPGFGNTATLLKRLRRSHQPIRSFLLETWDKFRNRPLWCSQQAVRNVQQDADVVLYLVDASQKPEDCAYVGMEMEILQWIGKPVLVLLNQIGPPKLPLAEQIEEEGWRNHLGKFSIVRNVISLDAFARCWAQEHVLLDAVEPLLPAEKRTVFQQLNEAWRRKNEAVFDKSMQVLGKQIAESVCDREAASKETILQKLGVGRKSLNEEMDSARESLSRRLAERSVAASNELIQLHELSGRRRDALEKARDENFAVPQKVNESLWTAVGGILSGAAVGVAADIKTGGLTLGGGTILGVFAGGAGSYLLAKGYNLARGSKDSVRWTEEHFAAQVETALLFYLAVSHWGRGRGEWAEADHPAYWKNRVHEVVHAHRKQIDGLWKQGNDASAAEVTPDAAKMLRTLAGELLALLYPVKTSAHTVTVQEDLPPPPPL